MINKKSKLIKLSFIIVAIIVALTSIYLFLTNIPVAYAMELDGNEYDQVFLKNIDGLAKDNYGTDIDLVAEKELLYDLNLNKLGYIYDFTVNNEHGYAIVINYTGEFEMAEVFFDAVNPYAISGQAIRVYVTNMTYLYYDNQNYYLAKNDMLIDSESLKELKEMALYGSYDDFTYDNETISFTSKSEDAKDLAKRHPYLSDSIKLSNGCAAITGANLIQYWDRYCPELIPNYTPGSEIMSYYLYKGESTETDKVMVDLYNDMGTNTEASGTSISQFKSGFEKYIKRNGSYILTYSYCISSGKFDYNLAKSYINSGEPIVLFLSTFIIITLNSGDNSNDISYTFSKYKHTMAAFGYKDITYTLTNGTQRNDKYLAVATGVREFAKGYFNISYKTNIDEALAIKINWGAKNEEV